MGDLILVQQDSDTWALKYFIDYEELAAQHGSAANESCGIGGEPPKDNVCITKC
jgi:hypothetical protein